MKFFWPSAGNFQMMDQHFICTELDWTMPFKMFLALNNIAACLKYFTIFIGNKEMATSAAIYYMSLFVTVELSFS